MPRWLLTYLIALPDVLLTKAGDVGLTTSGGTGNEHADFLKLHGVKDFILRLLRKQINDEESDAASFSFFHLQHLDLACFLIIICIGDRCQLDMMELRRDQA